MSRTLPTLRRTLPLTTILATTLAVIAPAAPAAAADPAGHAPLAVATVHAGGVDFLPTVAYSAAKVTVSGQDMVYERSFGANERLSIGLFEPDGRLLADGVYRWQLALTPTAADARELRRAAKQNGGEAPGAWLPQSGTFALRDGLMVDAGLVESQWVRPATGAAHAELPRDLAGTADANLSSAEAADGDEAVAAGRAVETRVPAADSAAGSAPAVAVAAQPDADAAAAARGPAAPRAASDEQTTDRRSWPTDGKNGREQ